MNNTAIISNIQHFSIGDGEGIRTTVFFSGCNLSCEWCHNPETWLKKGNEVLIDDILNEIYEDIKFYGDDGGVTLSGGEPLLQLDSSYIIAKACKANGISVIVDTAGNVDYNCFDKMIDVTDCFLFDLKGIDCISYKEKTGGDFELIISNLNKLSSVANVVVRVLVIPNYNDNAEFFEQLKLLIPPQVKRVDLIPFHRMGISKYKDLGITYKYQDVVPRSIDSSLVDIIKEKFNVNIEI